MANNQIISYFSIRLHLHVYVQYVLLFQNKFENLKYNKVFTVFYSRWFQSVSVIFVL